MKMAIRTSIISAIVLLVIVSTSAFQSPNLPQRCMSSNLSFRQDLVTSDTGKNQHTVVLEAKKSSKKADVSDPKERKKSSSAIELFFLYMNPLRNPNSIFVYFILIINVLAKIKENQ
mmetsp:Transcript_28827/g.40539  ORF Transcript_28827/g.40539 Transcript_28827/m.40539 type:complete len:117 (+) Transcript_28827:134-484(+)